MAEKIKMKMIWNRLRLYASVFLLAFYIVVGGVFIFSDTWADLLPNGRYVIGIVLILFGVLRFYVAYRRYMNKDAQLKAPIKVKENAPAK
jgi:cytochrome c biogenesis protein CcdA